jgi:hypothetical protein
VFGPQRIAGAGTLALALWLCALLAQAQADVMVQVRDKNGAPAEGRVELKDGEGTTVAACATQAGGCALSGVPGGSYAVHLTPAHGPVPKPTKAMIPPQGKVTLIVNTGS